MHLSKLVPISLLFSAFLFLSGFNCGGDNESFGSAGQQQDKQQYQQQQNKHQDQHQQKAQVEEKRFRQCLDSIKDAIENRNPAADLSSCGFGSAAFMSANAGVSSGEDINVETLTAASESIKDSAGTMLNMKGALIAPQISLKASEIVLKGGVIIAFDKAEIECQDCDLSEGLFFGNTNTQWILNGGTCKIKGGRLMDCVSQEELAKKQAERVAAIELFRTDVKSAIAATNLCGYGNMQLLGPDIPYDSNKGKFIFAADFSLQHDEPINLNFIIVGNSYVTIKAPSVTMKGYYFAKELSTIECVTHCDYSEAIFLGPATWTVNGKPCVIDKKHHLQCEMLEKTS